MYCTLCNPRNYVLRDEISNLQNEICYTLIAEFHCYTTIHCYTTFKCNKYLHSV